MGATRVRRNEACAEASRIMLYARERAEANMMRPLLALSRGIDLLNEKPGSVCDWLVLAACVVSAANAMVRYAYGY